MVKQTKKLIVQFVALLFLILGVLGLFLPFLQGILFILMGLILLSIYHPGIKERTDAILKKYPAFKGPVDKVEQFFIRIIGTP